MNKPADSWMILKKWFPDLSDETWEKLKQYTELLREWNTKINLVSRKDMDRLETKHLAHCLTLTKFLRLMPKARLLDVGTGGGLPGIPMAICYPQARFTLMDSIGKKIMVKPATQKTTPTMIRKFGSAMVIILHCRFRDGFGRSR